MRVALVVPTFPQLSETFIVAKAVGLYDRGWDVHIVCALSPAEAWDAYGSRHPVQRLRNRVHRSIDLEPRWRAPARVVSALASTVAAHPAGARSYLRRGAPSLGRGVARSIVADQPLLAIEPDVVHFEFGALAPGRMHLGELLDCRVTVSFRGYDLAYAGIDQSGFYDEVWSRADRVHLLGHDLWARAQRRGAPTDLSHSLIPPAVDLNRFTPGDRYVGPMGTPERPVRILSTGRLHWKKGYEYALEALARLRRRGIEVDYHIVGGGPYLEAVAFWRHQLGLDDCVELRGALPPDQVLDELRWADVFVHAAVSEGFGNAVLEAQATGLPVVTSDADGLSENVAHGETGLVVPRRDPDALADALHQAVTDDQLRARLGAAGPVRVAEHFGLEQHLDAWELFYEKALAGDRT